MEGRGQCCRRNAVEVEGSDVETQSDARFDVYTLRSFPVFSWSGWCAAPSHFATSSKGVGVSGALGGPIPIPGVLTRTGFKSVARAEKNSSTVVRGRDTI